MALFNFIHSVSFLFLGIFFFLFCIACLVAGVIGLILLFTPFLYFPEHRLFLLKWWTFVVTSTILEIDDPTEKEKFVTEAKRLSRWDSIPPKESTSSE